MSECQKITNQHSSNKHIQNISVELMSITIYALGKRDKNY